MPISPQEALQRTIEHREIFHDEMLALMRRIDEQHLQLPFYGSRRMAFGSAMPTTRNCSGWASAYAP